jgi:hypothetical protein
MGDYTVAAEKLSDIKENLKAVIPTKEVPPKEDPPAPDAIYLAYSMLLKLVNTAHQTALIEAKELRSNAAAQNRLIGQEAAANFQNFTHKQLFSTQHIQDRHVKFITIPNNNGCGPDGMQPGGGFEQEKVWYTTHIQVVARNPDRKDMDSLEANNQETSAIRGVLESRLGLLRQGGSISETNMNSTVDEDQQTTQAGSGLMDLVEQLTGQIMKI